MYIFLCQQSCYSNLICKPVSDLVRLDCVELIKWPRTNGIYYGWPELDVRLQDRVELPGESRSDMQAVHILADEVFEVAGPLQPKKGHVS